MQVSIENVGTLGRKLTVRLPADQLEESVRSRVQEMGRTTRIRGFRPGKVPARVIEQRFGGQIRGEALSELIRDSYQKAVEQEKLQPAVQPAIDTTGEAQDGHIEYTATFDVLPEFGTIDVSGLEILRPTASVEDADIDTMIETLRQQRRTWEQVEEGGAEGDMVLFEFSAEAEGLRHPEEGSDRVGTILGSKAFPEALETALTGQAPGSKVDVEVSFPDGFQVEALAGRTANVHAEVVRVQSPRLPEVDAAFMASFGVEGGDLDQFRSEVRANLERELEAALMARLKAGTIEKLVDAWAETEVPPMLVEQEARAVAARNGDEDPGAYTAYLGPARRRVLAGLLLTGIAEQQGLRLDGERLQKALLNIASTYEDPAEVIELYSRDPQLMDALRGRVMEDQVIDWISSQAKVSEQALAFNDVMRPGS